MSKERTVVYGQRLGRLETPARMLASNFKLANYLPALPAAPATLDLTAGIGAWPMFANDHLGDCTCAAIAHMVEIWTEEVDHAPELLTDTDVITLYNLVNGGGDNGADMGNVLRTVRHQGIGNDSILGYAEVNVANLDEVKAGCWLFSGLYIGAELCTGNQGQATWDAVDGPQGAPGSWGGHAINVVGYDEAGGFVVTWGALKRFTWKWWERYVDEAYVAIPKDYERLLGAALTNGFNLAQLEADLASLPNAQS